MDVEDRLDKFGAAWRIYKVRAGRGLQKFCGDAHLQHKTLKTADPVEIGEDSE